MCKYKSIIDLDGIKSFLRYDKETGEFWWLKANSNRIKVGDKAGSLAVNGYYEISYKKQRILAHRLVWFFEYGLMPDGVIDHINGKKTDNRACNLRCVSQLENSQNSYEPTIASKSGVRGVYQNHVGSWVAQITANGNKMHLGSFKTKKDAQNAYVKAKLKFHSLPDETKIKFGVASLQGIRS